MLVLPHADGLGVDFHQLRQRVLEPPGDGHGGAEVHAGKVLDTAVVYPTYNERKKTEAIALLSRLIQKHGVEHIAIGNGTASRETGS